MVTTDTFTYTNQDRLALHVHQIDGGDVQLLANNTYDALGQLTSKKVGGSATAYTSLQKVDYQYNIRGWLQSINDVTGLISTDLENRDDLFAFKISYNTPTDSNKALYNGNISETYWRTMYDDQQRKYTYTYDHLNRLLRADYSRPDNGSVMNNYKEEVNYDKNGNITDLGRTGGYEGSDYEIEIDKLVYVYDTNNKNQLIKVTDNSYSSDGFAENKDPNGTSNDDYAYDANGNMTRDDNKAITNICYNHLNLPFAITFLNNMNKNTKIEYLYDATGKKVGKKVHYFETFYPPGGGGDDEILLRGAAPASTNSLTGGATHTQTMDQTDYMAGGYQYKNSVLEFFPHAEGFVKWVEGSPQYHFNYTDHLGNVRVTYYDKGDGPVIAEESNYYPFGLQHQGYNVPDQYIMDWGNVTTFPSSLNYKYKYNGKELQDELGLNMYDYGARNYDAAIGRWVNLDALSEEFPDYSPYVYTFNDPVRHIDPDGNAPEDRLGETDPPGKKKQKIDTNSLRYKVVEFLTNMVMSMGELGAASNGETANTPEEKATHVDDGFLFIVDNSLLIEGVMSINRAPSDGEYKANYAKGTTEAAAKAEVGFIYKVPGEGTSSGKPYIGKTTKSSPAERGKGATDKRDRSIAKIIDTYDKKNAKEGSYKEQRAINKEGGIKNLDNKRNEMSKKNYDAYKEAQRRKNAG